MPKRSNLFQRIVRALYEALKPVGGTVTESAQLLETTTSKPREIDVLAEAVLYGVAVRIAVEVRDRNRKDEVQWIDSLIGKFKDLSVDKIIAVSATGFSAAARMKAEAAGIHLLTAKDAEGYDWPSEFQRLGIGLLTRSDDVQVSVRTDPPGRRDIDRDCRVMDLENNDLGSFGEFIEFVADRHRSRLTEMLRTKFFDHYKTLADLSKVLVSEDVLLLHQSLQIRTNNGDKVAVVHAAVRARTSHTVSKIPVRHTTISTHLVSSAAIPKADGQAVELFAIQSNEKLGTVNVQIRPKPKKGAQNSTKANGLGSDVGVRASHRVKPAVARNRKGRSSSGRRPPDNR